ncbi:MAG TPA: Mur ligase family protein, partial [Wenzhouxiangella sp.]|nr:Mur ligase family protein [Wenzhouxiangella sp.]
SFTKLPATIAVVTNIDPEHLDHYGSVEALHRAFESFLENIPFYGLAICCIDHPAVQALIARVEDRRIVTYGFGPQADICAENLRFGTEGSRFDLVINARDGQSERIENLFLHMVGEHNVQNALVACALAVEMGLGEETLRKALETFGGVKRRFTKTGEVGGITVVDDYAHHPVEIRAVLRAARQAAEGRVIAVVQPHRYSRLRDLFEEFCTCFNDADSVLVADVYAAGEEPIPGVNREALVQGLRAHGHKQAAPLADPLDLARIIARAGKRGDIVVCLGAGNITNWAQALPAQIAVHLGGGK